MKLLNSSSLSLGGLGLYIYAGVVYIDGLMGGWVRDCLFMCTEMGSSIVMYNFGVGPGGPYISANLEGHQR